MYSSPYTRMKILSPANPSRSFPLSRKVKLIAVNVYPRFHQNTTGWIISTCRRLCGFSSTAELRRGAILVKSQRYSLLFFPLKCRNVRIFPRELRQTSDGSRAVFTGTNKLTIAHLFYFQGCLDDWNKMYSFIVFVSGWIPREGWFFVAPDN